jgi:hypothetical protein
MTLGVQFMPCEVSARSRITVPSRQESKCENAFVLVLIPEMPAGGSPRVARGFDMAPPAFDMHSDMHSGNELG